MKYFKMTNEKENHNGFQYKDGLNVYTIPFDGNSKYSCIPDSLCFSDEKHICECLDYSYWIREVEIPKGEKVIKHKRIYRYKCNSIILKKRYKLNDIKTWKHLVKCGVDVNGFYDFALLWAIEDVANLEIVKFLVEEGADIHTMDDEPIMLAAKHGHLEIVKFLVEEGADIHIMDDEPIMLAAERGYSDVVEFLVFKGANFHARNDAPIKFMSIWMCCNLIKRLSILFSAFDERVA